MQTRTYPRQSYTVGIICALDVEKAAVEATLDEEHGRVEKAAGDDNAYTFGKIGAHNVVVACLPAGVMGKVSAAAVAKDMMRSFPIKVGLMVGICGGVWSERADVRLGDVVVSQPEGTHGGLVQWDYGKMERDGVFRQTGILFKPPAMLLATMQSLKARHMLKGQRINRNLEEILRRYPIMSNVFQHPGQDADELFEASYAHAGGDTCDHCDRSRVVTDRPLRKDDRPHIHYGLIASGDQRMKDGLTRDRVARREGILCFESEAAGLMDTFPCVVIRGVCDYADSHRYRRWLPYAALTAACYAKEFLEEMTESAVSSALEDTETKSQRRRRRDYIPTIYSVADSSIADERQDVSNALPKSPAPSERLKSTWVQRIKVCYLIIGLGLVVIGGSLAVGLFFSISENRMGDGFTTAGWMTAAGTLILAVPMAKHYPNCQCWDHCGSTLP